MIYTGLGFNGNYDNMRLGGGIPVLDTGEQDRSGYREGSTRNKDLYPVPNILVACYHIPSRQIVAFARSDENGKYRIDGLNQSGDYLIFAHPDRRKLGDDYNFPRTWGL